MTRPLVSAIVPAFNAARTIRRAIDSILKQAADVQAIVCDDGSTDGTAAILREYGDRVVVVTQPNRGRGAARNACLARATGEFIALLDADDWWTPSMLEVQLAAAAAHPDAGLFYANAFVVNRDGRIYRAMNGEWHVGHSGWVFPFLVRNNFVPLNTVVVRRATLEAVGPFDETLPRCQDLEWLLRVAATAPFHYTTEPLGYCDDGTWGTQEKRGETYRGFLGALDRVAARHPELARRHHRHFAKSRSDAWSELGRLEEDGGAFEAGARCYETALEQTPGSHALRSKAAVAWYRAGRLDEAERAFQWLLLVDPYHPDAHFYLGNIAMARRAPAAAVEAFENALYGGYLYQKFPECVNNLGVACAQTGARGRAAELFTQSLAQQAFYSDALRNLEALEAGDVGALRLTPRRVF
jgi:GT2 family glycosyltransferase